MRLSTYSKLCDAVVLLMAPLVEIVIHDVDNNCICYIKGGLSNRKIGDPSLLDVDTLYDEELTEVIYAKLGFDGRLIKSISVLLEQKWLLCINCDISIFHNMQNIAAAFTQANTIEPLSVFKNDWQERLHISIHTYLKEHSWNFSNLKSSQKKSIVHHLFTLGAFNEKKAADYVAETLDMGRATIFNYMKEWRSNENV